MMKTTRLDYRGHAGQLMAFVSVILTFFMLAQCACQKGVTTTSAKDTRSPVKPDVTPVKKPKPQPPKIALPTTLDLKDLDADEKKVLHSVLKDQFDPCGKPVSFLKSLMAKKPCKRALEMGKFVVDLVTKGFSKKQITVALLKKLKQTASKAVFDLTDSPSLGDPKSKWVIVEFTDFQCPYCKQVATSLKALAKKYKAVLYIKHFPLTDIHAAAKPAAIASVAAHRQGKFWAFSKVLFDNQEKITDATIPKFAKKAGLDMARFKKDLKDPKLKAIVTRDMKEGERAGERAGVFPLKDVATDGEPAGP